MLSRLLGRAVLRVSGWRVDGAFPGLDRAVLVAAPHTSNWDFIYMKAVCLSEGVHVSFIAKHTLFWEPLGSLLRWMGGIPVRRDRRSNTVQQLARIFAERDQLILAIPPEGTRGHVPYWKSGFYHTAHEARVPVLLGYLDYARRAGGFGPHFQVTGNIPADMDRIREFYSRVTARYPEKFGVIRLRDEARAAPPHP